MAAIEILKKISAKQTENKLKQDERQAEAANRFNELNNQVINDAWFLTHGDAVRLSNGIVISPEGIDVKGELTPELVDAIGDALVSYYIKIDDITNYL